MIEADNDNTPSGKICSKCGEFKLLCDFSRSAKGLFGLRAECKACHAEHKKNKRLENLDEERRKAREKYAANPEKARGYAAKWRANNLDHTLEYGRMYREENRELLREKDRARIAADPEKHAEKSRVYREKNPEKHMAAVLSWQSRNPDKSKQYMKKKTSTLQGRLENTLRSGVHRGITSGSKAGRRTFAILGYTKKELMSHLERLFKPGMSWSNYGEWHIDHKIPLAAHIYETPDCDGFKQAWALSNLQPMWASENKKKHAKLIYTG